ncbi:hypothetical protein [Oceanibium sediminis]|uniref:hypothetical protein n=1 Tax=Oceanibium sediminis TaxID=2026339 RepID=UPI00130057A2|nr:hypothetical protein [Oceanibium sediminis]
MLDWLWNWPPMAVVQGWVDATRAWVDPIWLIAGLLLVALFTIARLNRAPTERDVGTQGAHYLGNIDPKKLPGMLNLPRRKRLKSRAEMEKAIRKGAERRRLAEEREKR